MIDILGSIDNSIENAEQTIKKIAELAILLVQTGTNKTSELKPFIRFVKGKKPLQNGTKKELYLSIEGITTGKYTLEYADSMIMAEAFDILMVMDGASSGTVYSHQQGIVSSTLAKIEVPTELNDYLYWYLLSLKDTIKTRNTGSAIPHANKDYIASLCFDFDSAINQHNRVKLRKLREEIIDLQSKIFKLQQLKALYLKKFFD